MFRLPIGRTGCGSYSIIRICNTGRGGCSSIRNYKRGSGGCSIVRMRNSARTSYSLLGISFLWGLIFLFHLRFRLENDTTHTKFLAEIFSTWICMQTNEGEGNIILVILLNDWLKCASGRNADSYCFVYFRMWWEDCRFAFVTADTKLLVEIFSIGFACEPMRAIFCS